jgi:hypothetical protein
MKSKRFSSRKRGGFLHGELAGAVGASALPVGLLLAQQYYKRKSNKRRFGKFNKYRRSFKNQRQ